jgi:hypothetical protein
LSGESESTGPIVNKEPAPGGGTDASGSSHDVARPERYAPRLRRAVIQEFNYEQALVGDEFGADDVRPAGVDGYQMNQAVVEALMGYTNACACSKLMFTRRESGRLY